MSWGNGNWHTQRGVRNLTSSAQQAYLVCVRGLRGGFGAAGIAALIVAGFFGVRAVSGPDEPKYYVEGARPAPDADDQASWVRDGEAPEGCVPYSPDRPKDYVCGELPPGWEPGPPPGSATDYPDVCEVAAQVIQAQAEELSRDLQLQAPFRIDPTGCQAGSMGSKDEGRWMASFPLVDEVTSPGGSTYTTAVVWEFTLEGTGPEGERPVVFLSSKPGAGQP